MAAKNFLNMVHWHFIPHTWWWFFNDYHQVASEVGSGRIFSNLVTQPFNADLLQTKAQAKRMVLKPFYNSKRKFEDFLLLISKPILRRHRRSTLMVNANSGCVIIQCAIGEFIPEVLIKWIPLSAWKVVWRWWDGCCKQWKRGAEHGKIVPMLLFYGKELETNRQFNLKIDRLSNYPEPIHLIISQNQKIWSSSDHWFA